MMRKHIREESDEGFTMVEILVVIIIIGILAAIAIPIFLNQRRVANDAALMSDVRNAALVYETWRATDGNDDAELKKVTKHSRGYSIFAADDAVYASGAFVWNDKGDLPQAALSSGTLITLRTPVVSPTRPHVEGRYCLIGTNPNSNYDYANGDGAINYHTRLFYDSAQGGLTDIQDIAAAYEEDPNSVACHSEAEAYAAL